jgi:hypothetical protein
MAAQYALVNTSQAEKPSCFLKFEKLHYSTSVNEQRGISAIKLNITSECTREQIETRLVANIYLLKNGKENKIYSSDPTRQLADKKDRRKAYFLDFWVECQRGSTLSYRGNSKGEVTLKDGGRISVSGNTGKFIPIKCESQAK